MKQWFVNFDLKLKLIYAQSTIILISKQKKDSELYKKTVKDIKYGCNN